MNLPISKTWEYNFDGLIGPTHNYAGLSIGNIASMTNRNQISQPKKSSSGRFEKNEFFKKKRFSASCFSSP